MDQLPSSSNIHAKIPVNQQEHPWSAQTYRRSCVGHLTDRKAVFAVYKDGNEVSVDAYATPFSAHLWAEPAPCRAVGGAQT